jgi:hypothetical protein
MSPETPVRPCSIFGLRGHQNASLIPSCFFGKAAVGQQPGSRDEAPAVHGAGSRLAATTGESAVPRGPEDPGGQAASQGSMASPAFGGETDSAAREVPRARIATARPAATDRAQAPPARHPVPGSSPCAGPPGVARFASLWPRPARGPSAPARAAQPGQPRLHGCPRCAGWTPSRTPSAGREACLPAPASGQAPGRAGGQYR